MTPEAAMLSRRYGGNPTNHRARVVTEELLTTPNLVLTATRAQRRSVVQLVPRASRWTFTIREFSRLLGAASRDGGISIDPVALVDEARSRRGFLEPLENPDDDDVEDPYLRPIEVYERVAAVLNSEIEAIAAHLMMRGRSRGNR